MFVTILADFAPVATLKTQLVHLWFCHKMMSNLEQLSLWLNNLGFKTLFHFHIVIEILFFPHNPLTATFVPTDAIFLQSPGIKSYIRRKIGHICIAYKIQDC
jgi:hypothetical protein